MKNLLVVTATVAASIVISAMASTPAATRPVLVITFPAVKATVAQADITVTGKTTSSVPVTGVWYQLNSGPWEAATPGSTWATWTASVTLTPGTNAVGAYALDQSGTKSQTNTVKFVYALPAALTLETTVVGVGVVTTVSPGTVTTNGNPKALDVGIQYTLAAKANPGFSFESWSGSFSTNTSALTFIMAPNLTLNANFKDIAVPSITITSPKSGGTVGTTPLTVTGTASDNVGVTAVKYQVNGGAATPAETSDGWANWTANVPLKSGANSIVFYSLDGSGNESKPASLSVTYTATGPTLAPASLSGLGAVVTEEGLSEGFSLYFGTGTFSQSMLPGDDLENNSSGTYTYKVTGADTALLAVTPTAPPNKASGQATEVALTFTNAQGGGTYFATNHDGTVSSGALEFSTLANVAPSSLAGLTAYMTNSLNQTMRTVFTGSSFSSVNLITSSGGEGSFTFTRVSPASGLVKLSFTGPTIMDGYTGYTIVAFLTDTSGTWAQEIFNKKGKVANTDYGTFVTE